MIEQVPPEDIEETISDRLVPEIYPVAKMDPLWVEALPKTGDEVTCPVPAVNDPEPDVPVEISGQKEGSIKARRFLELVVAGEEPARAARKLHTKLQSLIRDDEVRLALKNLLEGSRLPADVRKEMVRAGLNSMFMRNVSGKLKEQKIALEAAKQIARDPEVGLNLPPMGVAVPIDVSALGQMMSKMKPIPGLEDILDVDSEDSEEKEDA